MMLSAVCCLLKGLDEGEVTGVGRLEVVCGKELGSEVVIIKPLIRFKDFYDAFDFLN